MPAERPPTIPLATARRAAVRVLRALSSNPDVLRLGVRGALRRMEPRVPAVELFATTLEADALAEGRIEAALAALDFVRDGELAPGVPVALTVLAEEAFVPPSGPEIAADAVGIEAIRGAFHLHALPGRGRHALPMVAARAAQEGYDWALVTAPAAALEELRAQRPGAEAAARPEREEDDPRPPPPPFRLFLLAETDAAGLTGGSDAPVLLHVADTPEATIRALSDPRVKVLAHPPEAPAAWYGREADDVASWQQVLDAAAARGVALEFSGAARAAWLPDAVHAEARSRRVPVLPGADAEALNDIDDLLCAVGPLRLAGWRADEVLATRDAEAFEAWLAGGPA